MNILTIRSTSDHAGFTLVELMIALVIAGFISAILYTTYHVQQRSYIVQEQVAEMQQNIRAAIMFMSRDIRMAGYDPQDSSNFKIKTATPNRMGFSVDLNENGSVDGNETITYGFSAANDGDADGIADAGSAPLGKCTVFPIGPPGFQPVVENIQAIEFRYFDASGANLGGASGTVPLGSLANIRSVTISILARASRPDPKFTNTRVYTPASGTPWDLNGAAAGNAPNDNYRRRLLITTIQCRNMGL